MMEPQKKLRVVLSPYLLEDAEVGEEISRGTHDSLVRVKCLGVEYHGKKLHDLAVKLEKKKNDEIMTRLKRECEQLISLRHPRLVQFMGVVFSPNDASPILVNENISMSVASALDSHTRLPLTVQLSILQDVAQGLVFLHCRTKPIIHGDLTARNVLLTRGLQAKIADLGVAQLFDPSSSKMTVTMTKSPETAAYSPPEILKSTSSFIPHLSVDIYSFGVLSLHIASGKCPIPCRESSVTTSELDRRKEYIDMIKKNHCLLPIVEDCIVNDPKHRSQTHQLYERIRDLSSNNPLPYESALELIFRMERREGELLAMVERVEVERMQAEGIGKQLNTYDEQLTAVKEQMKSMEEELVQDMKGMPLKALNKILLPQKDASKTSVAKEANTSQPFLKPTQNVFHWKRSALAPTGMQKASAVVLEGKLYIGGGETKDLQTDRILYEYDINGVVHKWTALPICPVAYYAIGIVNRSLVLIGGVEIATRKVSNKLYLWDRERQEWTPSLPCMPTARQNPSAASYNLSLIVAGGYRNSKVLADVEMFDQATFQWQTLANLPIPCTGASCCIVRDVLYLVGGTLYGETGPQTSVQALTLSENPGSEIWNIVADTPLTSSCAVPSSNFMLAVGGSLPGSHIPNRSIHVYFPSLDKWDYLCEMPTARCQCVAAVMSAGRLFVYGGKEEGVKPIEYGNTVEILTV